MPTKRSQEFMDLKHGSDKKASKPLIEKRRRARINYSLSLLKALVIDSKTESTRQTKLEKADILEMTVQYLREIKKGQISVTSLDTRYAKKTFESGYMECVQQVELFLATLTNPNLAEVETDLKNRLKDHLWQCLQDKANSDESSQVDAQNRTPSPDQQSNSSSPVTSFFASNASTSQNGRSDNLFFENNLPQNDTPLKSHNFEQNKLCELRSRCYEYECQC
ncbi:transcription factor HES-1 [Caerostris extrusa]|uniref:Transcription factor HES-1 n=1 Tax=Caerostris extrusa TaxID=172846 RepID=A0AAV4RVM7_CAEEX|nr:transcription factor HES-1 [Caerostris extrusa]